jgi:hypothetical protein
MSRRALAVLLTASAAVIGGLVVPAGGAAETAAPRLPDLGMARLADVNVTTTASGQKQLRFSATVVNVGSERFEVTAARPDAAADFAVAQRVFNSDGSATDVPVSAQLVFAGDGHQHWHVKDLATYRLERLDNGVKVGTSAKGGFCFFDTTSYRLSLPGAPQSPVYSFTGCGTQDSLQLTMGVSVGWGDRYRWTLPDQYIDITAVANGKYRVYAAANEFGRFQEVSATNNATWVDVSLSTRRGTTSVKVLRYGPAA